MIWKTDLIMIPRPPRPFPRHRHLNPLPQHRLMLRNQTDIRQPLLHDHGHRLRALRRIDRLPHHLQRNTIPPLGLFQREIPLQLQVQRVELPDFGEFVFLGDLTGDVELAGLRVEVDASHPD